MAQRSQIELSLYSQAEQGVKKQSTTPKENTPATPYSRLFQCPVLQINLNHLKLIDKDDVQSFVAVVPKRQFTRME